MKILLSILLAAALGFALGRSSPALAHHGGVSLTLGAGSPMETASPLTLPEGGLVASARMEYAPFRKFAFAEPENKDSFTFYSLSFIYGFRPYLSTGIVVPYAVKTQDTFGTNQGLGDLGLNIMLGFHHEPGKGFRLNRAEDTAVALDNVRKTYLALTGNVTFPTGKNDLALGGEVAPDMQPGFGSPSFTLGISTLKQLTRDFGLLAETSYQLFTEKDHFKFGNEWRLNAAGVYELYGRAGAFLQTVNGILELNLLHLSPDTENGQAARASGGTILYLSPGLRFSFPGIQNANLGVAMKFPILKNLNDESEQQGTEGLEQYRLVMTWSFFF
ncbi:MAG: hypothetical protein HY892_15825 [Deltaproteobacteria bacterium]|nr:hypothetical protein [Deltaproteobacteria bacterium]